METPVLLVLCLFALSQLALASRPLLEPSSNATLMTPTRNITGRELRQPRYYNWGQWNKASATFFNGFAGGACHCAWAGESCDMAGGRGVAMPKSFYEANRGHGDWDTWNGDGSPVYFSNRGMCGVCLEVRCAGCHSSANGHAGCTNGFSGCRSNGASVIVKVLDLLWEGDANRNTVKYHHNDLVSSWNDCSETDYCPRGDGTDYSKRMDMFAPAFSQIADPVTGIIKVEWRFAPDNAC